MDIVMTIIRPVRLLVCRMTTICQWQKMEVSELLQEAAMEGMDRLLWFFKKADVHSVSGFWKNWGVFYGNDRAVAVVVQKRVKSSYED